MRKIMSGADKGFTLLELAVVLAVVLTITTAAIPFFIRGAETTAAQKTAKEISDIQTAARWYYLTNRAWPGSIQALQSAGFLDPSSPPTNPWGHGYSISSNSRSLTLATTVPGSIGGLLVRALPGPSSSVAGTNQTVSSVIPLPGQEASLSVARNTAEKALTLAKESALPPYGPMIEYWGHGGGMPRCPEGYVVVRAYEVGGDNNMRMHCQKVAR